MYNVKSKRATEFIDDNEILETLKYAEDNKSNRKLIEDLVLILILILLNLLPKIILHLEMYMLL